MEIQVLIQSWKLLAASLCLLQQLIISEWAKLFSVGMTFPVHSFLSKDFAQKQEDKVFLTEQNSCPNLCKIFFLCLWRF